MTCERLLLARAVCLAAVALGAGAAVALVIWILAASAKARALLDLSFVAPEPSVGVALDTAATNLSLAAAVLLAALVLLGWPRFRRVLDLLLAMLLALNCLVLGTAAGGYGTRLLETLALHGPVELAAFALAGAAYLAARTDELTLPDLGAAMVLAVALLLAAALIETYAPVGENR